MPTLCVVYDLSFGKGVPLGTKENEKRNSHFQPYAAICFREVSRAISTSGLTNLVSVPMLNM